MSSEKAKVCVIGTGNVGTRFARIFQTSPVSPRTLDGLPADADLYIISVSDSAVKEVANKLPSVKGIVAHTTGSVPMSVLSEVKCTGYGVIYPFQTISRKRELSPADIPLLTEANDRESLEIIENIARQYGFTHIARADSGKRRRVHLCGVFACNFTNSMIAISQKILEQSGIDGSIINPLVEETVRKLATLPAKDAQTGPAIRKDLPTLRSHLEQLEELQMKEEADIYRLISDYLMNSRD